MKSVDPINVPFDFCHHQVPGLWRYLIPEEAKSFRLPRERRATCNDCPMSCFDEHDPLYRCCSYHPVVPNYLIGFTLLQNPKHGPVLRILENGHILPEGYLRTPQQWYDYLADIGDNRSDESARVQCPLLDRPSGLCTIYLFRNAVCSTFYCTNDHGKKGERFWKSLEEMVSHIELALCQWAMGELGLDPEGYFDRLNGLVPHLPQISDPHTKGWSEYARRTLWDKFYGKEIEFLVDSAKLISENRHRLWEIAENFKVLEAKKFERAQVDAVPEKYEDEVDPVDKGDFESAELKELWDDLKREYKALWKYPRKIKLNARANIERNQADDEESRAFAHRPFVLEYLVRKGANTYDWREFLTNETAEALKVFKKSKATDNLEKLLEHPELKQIEDLKGFLAEWHGKKVLEKVR